MVQQSVLLSLAVAAGLVGGCQELTPVSPTPQAPPRLQDKTAFGTVKGSCIEVSNSPETRVLTLTFDLAGGILDVSYKINDYGWLSPTYSEIPTRDPKTGMPTLRKEVLNPQRATITGEVTLVQAGEPPAQVPVYLEIPCP